MLGPENSTKPHSARLSVRNRARGRDQNLLDDYQQLRYLRQPVDGFGISRNKGAMEGECASIAG